MWLFDTERYEIGTLDRERAAGDYVSFCQIIDEHAEGRLTRSRRQIGLSLYVDAVKDMQSPDFQEALSRLRGARR